MFAGIVKLQLSVNKISQRSMFSNIELKIQCQLIQEKNHIIYMVTKKKESFEKKNIKMY